MAGLQADWLSRSFDGVESRECRNATAD